MLRWFEFRRCTCSLGQQRLWLDHLDCCSACTRRILITDLADTLVLAALMFTRHGHNKRRFGDVQDNAMYWNFVVLTWLPIYACLYWVPRLWRCSATASGGWRAVDRPGGRAGLWAVTTEAKYAVVQTACLSSAGLVTLAVAAVTALLVLGGRADLLARLGLGRGAGDANGRFLARRSARLTALLFAVSILLQGAAGFVFSDCHR